MPGMNTRMDAAESAFFQRELEHVKAKTYEKKYTRLKARELIPISREAGPAAETITYQMFDQVGIAKIISSYADDLPRADVYGEATTAPVKSLGSSYGYNVQEIRAAARANRPLSQMKANAARRAIGVKEETIAATGDTATGLVGLLNNANVSIVAAGTKTAGGLTWAVATPAELLTDLLTLLNTVYNATNGNEYPTDILLPPTQFAQLATTQNSTASDKTVLEFALEKFRPFGLRNIGEWYKLDGAGVGSVDRAVAYVKDPDYCALEIPQDFEQFPVQQKNLEYIVPCHERIGGVTIPYPIAFAYMDGI